MDESFQPVKEQMYIINGVFGTSYIQSKVTNAMGVVSNGWYLQKVRFL